MRILVLALLLAGSIIAQERLTSPVTVLPRANNSAPGEVRTQNKTNTGPIGVFSWADAWNVKNYPYYCAGDGTTDDTTCITNAISSNRALIFPEGTYKVHNNPDPLSFTGWTGSMHFEGTAKILCDNPHQGCFLFTGGSNQVLENLSYTYGATEPTDQCPDHMGLGNCWGWAFYGTQNTTLKNFTVNNGYGIGMLFIGGCAATGVDGCGMVSEPELHCIHPQVVGARITNTSRDGLNIQNCSQAVVSDVYTENNGDDSFGFQYSTDRWSDTGMTATNLYSYNSLGSCISDSQQNVSISNFMCDSPSTGGLLISYPGFILHSFSGTIAHGIIRNVAFRTGGICNCGQRGIDFFNGTDTVSFDDITISNTTGSGILMETFMETPPIVPNINFSNIRVYNAGVPTNTDGAGHCALFQAATNVTVRNVYFNTCSGFGAAFSNITNLTATGISIIDASVGLLGYVSNSAINLTANTNFQLSNVQIFDDQATATGFDLHEGGTVTSGVISNVQAYIVNGTFGYNTAAPTKSFNIVDNKTSTMTSNTTFAALGGTGSPIPFANPITVTDPGAANLITAVSGPSSSSTAAIVVGNGSIHHQAALGLFEGDPRTTGTLKWSLGHFEDNNLSTPDGFFLFDAKNGLNTFFVDPNATPCTTCGQHTRIQFQPNGGMFWAGLPFYADNASAVMGGLLTNDFYQDSSGTVRIVGSPTVLPTFPFFPVTSEVNAIRTNYKVGIQVDPDPATHGINLNVSGPSVLGTVGVGGEPTTDLENFGLTRLHGTVTNDALTASQPVVADGSKHLSSAKIDLTNPNMITVAGIGVGWIPMSNGTEYFGYDVVSALNALDSRITAIETLLNGGIGAPGSATIDTTVTPHIDFTKGVATGAH